SQSVGGSVSNSGTITAGKGMFISGNTGLGLATVAGNVVNSNKITATSQDGIAVASATVNGALINSGTINAAQRGIAVTTRQGLTAATVVGGITNIGTIVASTGIAVANGGVVGGITSSGTITGSTAAID